MHSLLIGAAFLIILLAPCLAAQSENLFPIRVRIPKRSAPLPRATVDAAILDPILPSHRRRNPTMIRHNIHLSRSSAAHPIAVTTSQTAIPMATQAASNSADRTAPKTSRAA